VRRLFIKEGDQLDKEKLERNGIVCPPVECEVDIACITHSSYDIQVGNSLDES